MGDMRSSPISPDAEVLCAISKAGSEASSVVVGFVVVSWVMDNYPLGCSVGFVRING